MYNLHRWFPTGLCLFLAPTKPLVHQQVSAVRRAIGLPLKEFAELTGQMKSEVRSKAYQEARMLFLTPQTLINDIHQRSARARGSCIVIDEAHKASGKHAYAQAVKLLSRSGGRILALSATPGQTLDRIQEVVKSLRIAIDSRARDETSIDVIGCLNERAQETRVLPLSGPVLAARDAVGRVYERTFARSGFGGFYETDITKLSRYVLVQAQQRYSSVRPEGVPAHIHFRNCAGFTIAVMMAQAYELVSAYGCGSCLSFLSAYLAPEGEGASDDDSDAEDGAAPKRKAGQSKAAAGKAKPRGGHMVQQERMSLFSSSEFEQMIGLVQRAEEGASHPEARRNRRAAQRSFWRAWGEVARDGLYDVPQRGRRADEASEGCSRHKSAAVYWAERREGRVRREGHAAEGAASGRAPVP